MSYIGKGKCSKCELVGWIILETCLCDHCHVQNELKKLEAPKTPKVADILNTTKIDNYARNKQ